MITNIAGKSKLPVNFDNLWRYSRFSRHVTVQSHTTLLSCLNYLTKNIVGKPLDLQLLTTTTKLPTVDIQCNISIQ